MIKIEVKGLDDLIYDFDGYIKYNALATSRALNRIGTQSRNKALRAVITEDKWNINIGTLKKLAKPKRAKVSDLRYTFEMASQSIYLHKWKQTKYVGGTTPKGRKRKASKMGVKYKLKKDKPPRYLKKSFMRKSLFGAKEMTVFTRRKSPRGANITAQASITPTSMFKQTGEEMFIEAFKSDFANRYKHELRNLKVIF